VTLALLAPRLVAREPWDVVVGFGRVPAQDVIRVGGGCIAASFPPWPLA
jgi:hypothetical protein